MKLNQLWVLYAWDMLGPIWTFNSAIDLTLFIKQHALKDLFDKGILKVEFMLSKPEAQ